MLSRIKLSIVGETGVSLVEMLIGVSIGLVVMGGSYGIFLTVSKVWQVNSSSMDQQADARLAVLKVSRELRSASKVIVAKSNTINFQMPTTSYSDQAPTAGGNTMDVTFSLLTENDWLNLKRTAVMPDLSTNSSIVARNLRNNNNPGATGDATRDMFKYYDSANNLLTTPVANPDQIQRVLIQVLADIDTTKRPGETLESTSIVIRTNALP